MSLRPWLVLIKTPGMLYDTNSSSGLRFKGENIASNPCHKNYVHGTYNNYQFVAYVYHNTIMRAMSIPSHN